MDPQAAAIANQVSPELFNAVVVIGVLVVRDMIRKAIALWKSGNKKQLARFICLFIFNTAGILPIIYLAFFQKKKGK